MVIIKKYGAYSRVGIGRSYSAARMVNAAVAFNYNNGVFLILLVILRPGILA